MPHVIEIPAIELFDEEKSEVISYKPQRITIEHSLISISKWEAKWHKAFISNDNLTEEETIDYIRCMTLTQNVDHDIYNYIPESEFLKVKAYMEDPMTATTFSDVRGEGKSKSKSKTKKVTSEELYFDMIEFNIPESYAKWHINRLLTLIRVCSEKKQPPKKMSSKDRRALNNARRSKYNTRG